jgi:hypothetical protein
MISPFYPSYMELFWKRRSTYGYKSMKKELKAKPDLDLSFNYGPPCYT